MHNTYQISNRKLNLHKQVDLKLRRLKQRWTFRTSANRYIHVNGVVFSIDNIYWNNVMLADYLAIWHGILVASFKLNIWKIMIHTSSIRSKADRTLFFLLYFCYKSSSPELYAISVYTRELYVCLIITVVNLITTYGILLAGKLDSMLANN